MASNKRLMTIHDITLILSLTLQRLATSLANIMVGFKVSGIQPLNSLLFSKTVFMSSHVTGRPEKSDGTQNQK